MSWTRLERAQLWAARNKCYVELAGQVGFGRECVGVLQGTHYVDTPGSNNNDFEGHSEEYLRRVKPPEHVSNYHKHDCLCVLGHRDNAVKELLDWIDQLLEYGATVRIEERRYQRSENNLISHALHGPTRAVISFPDLPEDDKTVYYWETEEWQREEAEFQKRLRQRRVEPRR